ncbi:MAG TPA: HEAT repeat domain-containing protein [bacterium]|nr:HEAT repeat domain-containing protein [bacterium]
MADEVIQQVYNDILNGGTVERQRAFDKLIEYPFEDIREFLFDGLRNNHHRIRSSCARILGQKGDETVIFPLLQAMSDDSWAIRTSAREALQHLPEATVLPALEGLVASQGANIPMLKTLTAVLSGYESREASSILVKLIQQREDPVLIEAVTHALGKRTDDLSITYLFHLLAHTQWNVRKTAVKALSELPFERIADRLKRELANPNRFIHMSVIEMLISRGDDAVIDLMADAVSSNNDLTRTNALNVLAGIGNDETYSLIVSLLGDPNPQIVTQAVDILGKSQSGVVHRLLVRCLKSSNESLRQNAVKTLGTMGSDDAIAVLDQMIRNESGAMKVAILRSLAQIGNRRCIRLIVQNCSIPGYADEVADILRKLDPDLAIQQMTNMLDEKELFEASVKALREQDRLKVFRALSSKLGSGTPVQQEKAVEAMGLLGTREAIPYLEKVVEGGFHKNVNAAAATALQLLRKTSE